MQPLVLLVQAQESEFQGVGHVQVSPAKVGDETVKPPGGGQILDLVDIRLAPL